MDRPERKPIRLKSWDYSAPGAYFVTICTREKRCILSRIARPSVGDVGAGVLDGPRVRLSAIGRIVDKTIQSMNNHYDPVSFDRYVIMPNHIPLLIRITGDGSSRTPTPTNAIIPACISTLKRMTNQLCGEKLWQRSYYDHIIRNEDDYRHIAEYIEANPTRWTDDRFYIDE